MNLVRIALKIVQRPVTIAWMASYPGALANEEKNKFIKGLSSRVWPDKLPQGNKINIDDVVDG